MKFGESASSWYLLRGYDLRAGEYSLHASGKAGVRWSYHPDYIRSTRPPIAPRHAVTDPVEGQMFDASMNLIIRDGTEAELKQQYAAYVADEEGFDYERRGRALDAIAELAPPFLEKTLLGFANRPDKAHFGVAGLGRIPTAESRSDLVSVYKNSSDLRLRASIVRMLAGIGTIQEIPFFSSLLAGRSTRLDDEIRSFAALGLGRIGGKDAVKQLERARQLSNLEVRASVVTALGNTRDASAIPILIQMYADPTVNNQVCLALETPTHYQWCTGNGVKESQAKWRDWWRTHRSQLRLYDSDHCPAFEASLLVQ